MIKAAKIWVGSHPVKMLFTASHKIWEAVAKFISCFSSGAWTETKFWSDTERWKENS